MGWAPGTSPESPCCVPISLSLSHSLHSCISHPKLQIFIVQRLQPDRICTFSLDSIFPLNNDIQTGNTLRPHNQVWEARHRKRSISDFVHNTPVAQMSQHHQGPPRRRGPWNSEEDSLLLHLVQSSGSLNWVGISNKIQGRSPKQCRERYHQNLRPGLNPDPITKTEGDLIEKLVREIGKKWAEIARRLGNGRSDNAVKNWWNGSQNRRKRADHKRHQHQHQHHQHQLQRVQQQPLPPMPLSMGPQHQHQHELQQPLPLMAPSMGQQHQQHQHQPRLMPQPMPLRPSAFFTSGRDIEAPLSSPQNYSPTSEHAPSLVSDNGSQYSTPRQPLERGFNNTQLPALELPERRSLSPGYFMMDSSSAPRNRSLPPLRDLLQSCPPVHSPEYGFYAQEREMFAGQVWRP